MRQADHGVAIICYHLHSTNAASPRLPGFRTILFAGASPIVLKFEKNSHYCPEDEEVFDEDIDEKDVEALDGMQLELKADLLRV